MMEVPLIVLVLSLAHFPALGWLFLGSLLPTSS